MYHLLGGCRHLFWDIYKIGNQVRAAERGGPPRAPLSAPTHRPGGALTAAARPAAQVDPSFLDKQAVEKSSYILFGASIAGSLYIALA